jgi:hypothetical protein
MKALSIIGMVLSFASFLLSFAIIDISYYTEWGIEHPGIKPGIINLIISLFFLAFSIVACVFAFRKKKS